MKIIKFAIMLDDYSLIEFRLKPIDPQIVISSEKGEVAYALDAIHHGIFITKKGAEEMLSEITTSAVTLGYEISDECDFEPNDLITFNDDKSVNSCYGYGGHTPGGKYYRTDSRFNVGAKVLCLMYQGYDVVFPAIVIVSLTEEYLRELYETDSELQFGYSSADEVVEKWFDWDWDSVVVHPLVRLRSDWEEMGETVIVNRAYLFPYKKYEL